MHVKMFEIAKHGLETEYGMEIVAGFLSPSHDGYVRSKLGTDAIPMVHRHEKHKEYDT